tara:strand:+ start:61 stop:222 length:162 start_codon:yes stop_codon:yes gene_type:complete
VDGHRKKIEKKMIKILDWYYSVLESIGVKLSQFAWHKRWSNRQTGTGYRKNKK